ncbi:MAG: DNA primase DnaG [Candidatus Micrarchaeota archaeon]
MGKTYIDTVKYQVYANVEIDGLVEKPDVVGAIFGQTEGLLGDELDLRELQKNGRIGRIEVDLNPRGGKSVGRIKLPSSLDMVETSILAAALETVDRVGPCDARIGVEKIEDTRTLKRKGLVDRAKILLKTMLTSEIPESKEISEQVRSDVKIAEISSYGPEKLPAGPNVNSMDSVILVEGRADVINLLKNDITNAVAVGGANVAKSVGDLSKQKETTAFLDGDRGGDIILAELNRICEIDFIARAPRGKEVEELTRKELIKCLRSKVPSEASNGSNGSGSPASGASGVSPSSHEDYRNYRSNTSRRYEQNDRYSSRPSYNRQDESQQENGYTGRQRAAPAEAPRTFSRSERYPQARSFTPAASPARQIAPQGEGQQAAPAPSEISTSTIAPSAPAALNSVPQGLLDSLNELENTLKARFYSDEKTVTKEVAVRDMIKTLEGEQDVYAIVFDGIITQRLADMASAKKARALVGIKLGNVFKKPSGVLLHTKQ